MFFDDAVTARETQSAKLFMQTDSGQVRVAFQQLRDLIRVRIEQTRPARASSLYFTCPAVQVFPQHAVHALAVDSQPACNRSVGSAGVVQPDDLVARHFPHAAAFISPTRSRLREATEAASRDNFSKRGARNARSSGVNPARPCCASHTSMRPS